MEHRMSLTDGTDLISPQSYGENGIPHDSWTALRRESPVHWCTPQDHEPFWAITCHADITEISKQPDLFSNEPGITVMPKGQVIREDEGLGAKRTIITMDPPDHRSFRKVASAWFTPRAVTSVRPFVELAARELVDKLAGETGEGECDFATDVAARHPLRILCHILGLPREQEDEILRLTNTLFAIDDPELGLPEGDREEQIRKLGLELFQLFAPIIEDRRKNPTDDLASLLANGKVGGELMGPAETLGYYLITFTAGHDTTKNALAGGMCALAENPDEFDKLKRNPDLARGAVEEVVRWASPVNYMKRTATADAIVHGQEIKKGQELVLFYASANRDESVFEDPFSFQIERHPNPHLGFGIGEHFCLGANLARQSQEALLRELAARVEYLELAGKPEIIASSFVVGLKHLPLRYKIRPAA
jgi:cytochrome P450